MADSSKAAIELNIPAETSANKQGNQAEGQHPDFDSVQEMPTITTLLQRKKLGQAKNAAANKPATAAPTPAPIAAAEPSQISIAADAPAIMIETNSAAPAAVSIEAVAPVVVEAPLEVAAAVAQHAAPTASEPLLSLEPATMMLDSNSAAATEVAATPVIAPSRRRTSNIVTPDNANASVARKKNVPPPFTGTLVVEKLEYKYFEKQLKRHKKSANLKKLDCIGYFSARFTEVAYFQVNQAGALVGMVGFGSPNLVSTTKTLVLSPELLPSIFEVLAQGETFVGAVENLRAEDQEGLRRLGFSSTACVGAFPMMHKKAVTGLWLCTADAVQELPAKELKYLKKLFTGLVF